VTSKEEWLALAERCEKATGHDREIDADICILANWIGPTQPHQMFQGPAINLRRGEDWNSPSDGDWLDWEDADGDPWSDCAPRLTASLDAITALIERELPGWDWSTAKSHEHCRANVWRLSPISRGSFPPKHATAATAALAMCAAFCRAMAAGA
jgi:hypothetical protein